MTCYNLKIISVQWQRRITKEKKRGKKNVNTNRGTELGKCNILKIPTLEKEWNNKAIYLTQLRTKKN